jgi:hypothetical protein
VSAKRSSLLGAVEGKAGKQHDGNVVSLAADASRRWVINDAELREVLVCVSPARQRSAAIGYSGGRRSVGYERSATSRSSPAAV